MGGRDELALRHSYPRAAAYPEAYLEDASYGAGEGEEGGAGRRYLHELWRAICKRKWMILLITLVFTLVVALESARVRPTYTAATIVEIRKDAPSMVIPTEADPENLVGIRTKILMFSSRPLLEDVVTQYKLDQNAQFLDLAGKRSRWDTLKSLVAGEQQAEPVESERLPAPPTGSPDQEPAPGVAGPPTSGQENPRLDLFVAILESRMKVEHVGQTQALRISFSHPHPAISALVANGLAQSFIKVNFRNKTESIANASRWLERATGDLKAKVEQTEEDLAKYSRDHGIFFSQGQTKLTTDKLVRLHEQYMRAQVDLLLKQSLYDEVKQGRGAQLPETFTDPRLAGLRQRLNDLSVTAAQLNLNYGPDNPRIQDVQQQMTKIQEQIEESKATLEDRVKSDYERAARDAQSLKYSLEQAKSEAVAQNDLEGQYSILKQNTDSARTLYNQFLQKASQAELEIAQQKNNVNVIRPARVPRMPDGVAKEVIVLAGFLLSLAGSVGLAFALEYFDSTIKSVDDVSRYAQLPTLGVIPAIAMNSSRLLPGRKSRKKIEQLAIADGALGDQASPASSSYYLRFFPPSAAGGGETERLIGVGDRTLIAEAYRVLRTSLLLSTAGHPPKMILFTSGRPGEGKTTTVINTAISLAQLGSSVLIIDADLRKPTTHKGLGVKQASGLSTYLTQGEDLDNIIQKLPIPGLSLLPCGQIPLNPAELISSQKMRNLLQQLTDQYDHLLIDSPPLMCVTDPLILSTQVDGVIMVVNSGKSAREVVRQSRQMLASVGARILGVVLNKVDVRDYRDSIYYPFYTDYSKEGDEGRISDILN